MLWTHFCFLVFLAVKKFSRCNFIMTFQFCVQGQSMIDVPSQEVNESCMSVRIYRTWFRKHAHTQKKSKETLTLRIGVSWSNAGEAISASICSWWTPGYLRHEWLKLISAEDKTNREGRKWATGTQRRCSAFKYIYFACCHGYKVYWNSNGPCMVYGTLCRSQIMPVLEVSVCFYTEFVGLHRAISLQTRAPWGIRRTFVVGGLADMAVHGSPSTATGFP
jgi:hypothetical protein